MNKKEIALIVIMILLSIVLVIGGTYAYYLATVTGNETAEDIIIASGYLELTFADGDSNIKMEEVLPGNQDEKTFTVTNTSTASAPFTYNIKLSGVVTDFEQKDLEYTLQEYTSELYDTPKEDGINQTGYINKDTINEEGEMYLAININAPTKGEKQYYKLTIEFKETNENQDYNKGKSFTGKINGDDNRNATLYKEPVSSLLEICNSNDPLNECLAKGEQVKNIFADETNNLRYAGPSEEVNNYIWFDCDDYDFASAEEAASKNCEKWRIIGLFKSVPKPKSDPEDLVKIIRADSVGEIVWDKAYAAYGSNIWTRPADLQTKLTNYYNGSGLSSGKEITKTTKPMIEQVTWNLGGTWYLGGSTASQCYRYERSSSVPSGAKATWNGYIGLMYVSDYAYATTGSNSGLDRNACLTTMLTYYSSSCKDKDWLYIPDTKQWTLVPQVESAADVFLVDGTGGIGEDNGSQAKAVRPSLYLKSTVQIMGGKGTSDEPYIIKQA